MAMAGISERRPLLAVMAMAALMVGFAEAQNAPPQSSGCTNSIANLSPCLSYVTGNGSFSRPTQGCCSGLATVVKTSAVCLCQLVSSTGNPLGIPINRTMALSLPGACNITTPPLSQCKAAGAPAKSPAVSPVSSPAKTPTAAPKGAITPAPATPETPSPVVVPGANSPSSSPAPSTATSKNGNIPSRSPTGSTGDAAVFRPSMMIIGAVVGVMSAGISIGW